MLFPRLNTLLSGWFNQQSFWETSQIFIRFWELGADLTAKNGKQLPFLLAMWLWINTYYIRYP
jgi:hypothetical protein